MQSKETKKTGNKNQPKKNSLNHFLNMLSEQAGLFIQHLKHDKQLQLIAGCVLALFVTGVLIIILNGSKTGDDLRAVTKIPGDEGSNPAAGTVDLAEVLPQQRRNDGTMEDGSWVPVNPYFDPFNEPIRLRGVAIGGSGGPMAIIESGGSSFIVKVGDYVDDLWAVLDIKRETVILRSYHQEISLFLDQPPLTRTLDVGVGDEVQEGS